MFEPSSVYHIYNCANGDENLFREPKNYVFFLTKYAKYIQPIADTFAYCLLPNHFHAMIRIKEPKEILEYLYINQYNRQTQTNLQHFQNREEGLHFQPERFSRMIEQQFSNFFNSYAKALNKFYGRKGSLFNPSMKKKEVKSDEYYTNLVLYIHNNPVKHGFTNDLWEWPYSSIQEFDPDINSFCILLNEEKQAVIDWFGDWDNLLSSHSHVCQMEIKSVFD